MHLAYSLLVYVRGAFEAKPSGRANIQSRKFPGKVSPLTGNQTWRYWQAHISTNQAEAFSPVPISSSVKTGHVTKGWRRVKPRIVDALAVE